MFTNGFVLTGKTRADTLIDRYCLVWFVDQWLVIPISFDDEPCGQYCVELGDDCKTWAVCNLATSVTWRDGEDDTRIPLSAGVVQSRKLKHEELFKLFAAFSFALTGVNKHNHIETVGEGPEGLITQQILADCIREDWNLYTNKEVSIENSRGQ